MRFSLEKWYADLAWGGGTEIHYRARFKLGKGFFGYTGFITPEGRHGAFGRTNLPRAENGGVILDALADVPGRSWTGPAGPPVVLHQSDDGQERLTWQPVLPNGLVSGPGLPPGVRGYVERLDMNLLPWRLGITRLLWGRFCGERRSLTWIVWEGARPATWTILDGQVGTRAEVSQESVSLPQCHLEFTTLRPLLDESLGHGALRGFPGQRLPEAVRWLQGRERKFVSTARLHGPEGTDEGMAIHEEVTW